MLKNTAFCYGSEGMAGEGVIFHRFSNFFMEGEKYFGGKMNPPGGFSTEERKEFLRRGSDGG